jgi:uroporphyrinogen decarboxylase
MNLKFQNALAVKAQSCPPIWFMRQAGRYHAHYQGLRSKHSFMDLCKIPELACEVALGPIRDFDFDVSILFSDLLFPLEAMGMGLDYKPGPVLGWHLNDSNIKNLKKVDDALQGVQFQKQAVIATREALPKDKSLVGFVGGPWTLFGYAVEGSHKDGLKQTKKSIHLFDPFCEVLMPLLVENIKLQLAGGVEVVMIFDTSVGEISPYIYKTRVEPYLISLAQMFPGMLGYYSKGTTESHYSENLKSAPWAGFGFDHRWDLPNWLKTQKKSGFVQGNFDQLFLFQEFSDFKKTLDEYLKTYQNISIEQRAGWVCGLGHGVLPETPEKNVKYFVERVREVLS